MACNHVTKGETRCVVYNNQNSISTYLIPCSIARFSTPPTTTPSPGGLGSFCPPENFLRLSCIKMEAKLAPQVKYTKALYMISAQNKLALG